MNRYQGTFNSGITLYCADSRETLPSLAAADVGFTDPPYDDQTHAGTRTLAKQDPITAKADTDTVWLVEST